MDSKNLGERVKMAPNAVTTGHCQIHLKPGGTVTPLPLVDPGQSPVGIVEQNPRS